MKSTFAISMLALCAGTLSAQPKKIPHSVQRDEVFKYAQSIVESKSANKTSKTSAIGQRVIAESGFDIQGGILAKVDSTRFKYSAGRGSEFDYNDLFHSPFFFNEPAENAFAYGHMKVKADSVWHWSDSPLTLYEIFTNGFTSTNKIRDYRYRNVWDNDVSVRNLITYDAFGKPTMVWLFDWNLSFARWDTSGKLVFTYNSQDQIMSDTTYDYNSGILSVRNASAYVYDPGGYLVSKLVKQDFGSGLNDFVKSSFSYYPDHAIKEMISEVNFGSGLQPQFRDSIGHAPGNLFIAHETGWIYHPLNMEWQPFYMVTRSANAQGLPDTTRFYDWEMSSRAWLLNDLVVTIFNPEANPEKVLYYHSKSAGLEIYYQYKFYYEQYNVLSFDNLTEQDNNIHVYPNPTSDIMNIQFTGQNNKIGNIQLVNSVGQTVLVKQNCKLFETEQLSLSGLVSGLYYLVVVASDGTIIHKQPVLKQ